MYLFLFCHETKSQKWLRFTRVSIPNTVIDQICYDNTVIAFLYRTTLKVIVYKAKTIPTVDRT